MPFITNGSVHFIGIHNEKSIVQYLQNTIPSISPIRSLFMTHFGSDCGELRFEHRGGTQTKTDAVALNQSNQEATISIKNHKLGTFDWLNSSNALNRDTYRTIQLELAELKTEFTVGAKTLPQIRTSVASVLNTHLLRFTNYFIKSLLSSIYAQYSDSVLIHDVANKELVCFMKEGNLLELRTFADFTYFLKSTRAKTSAQIWRSHNETGVEINTDLRIRLVLNNGITALLGTSSSNHSSVPCIKIQQDNVKKFILSSNAVHEPYIGIPHTTSIIDDGAVNLTDENPVSYLHILAEAAEIIETTTARLSL